jgi:hypothetical protein
MDSSRGIFGEAKSPRETLLETFARDGTGFNLAKLPNNAEIRQCSGSLTITETTEFLVKVFQTYVWVRQTPATPSKERDAFASQ